MTEELKLVKLSDYASPKKNTWQPVAGVDKREFLDDTYEFTCTLVMEKPSHVQTNKQLRWVNAQYGIPDGLPMALTIDQSHPLVEACRNVHRRYRVQVTATMDIDGCITIKGLA